MIGLSKIIKVTLWSQITVLPIIKREVTLWNEMNGLKIIDLEVTMRNQLYVFISMIIVCLL